MSEPPPPPKSTRIYPPHPSDRAPAVRAPSGRLPLPAPDEPRARFALTLAIAALGLALFAVTAANEAFEASADALRAQGLYVSLEITTGKLWEAALVPCAAPLALAVLLGWLRGGGRAVVGTLVLGAASVALPYLVLVQLWRGEELFALGGGQELAFATGAAGTAAALALAAAALFLGTEPAPRTWRGPRPSEPEPAPTDDREPAERLVRSAVGIGIAAFAGLAGGAVAAVGVGPEALGSLAGGGLVLALALAASAHVRRKLGLGDAERLLIALPAGPLLVLARAWGATIITDGFLAYGAFFERLAAGGEPGRGLFEGLLLDMLFATGFVTVLLVVESLARRLGTPAALAAVWALVSSAALRGEGVSPPAVLGGGVVLALALLAGELGEKRRA